MNTLLLFVQNVDSLQQAGAMQLLRPLLLDNVPRCATGTDEGKQSCASSHDGNVKCAVMCSIQQAAALTLGRLANHSDKLAEAIVANEILPQLVSDPEAHYSNICTAYHAFQHLKQCLPSRSRRNSQLGRMWAVLALLFTSTPPSELCFHCQSISCWLQVHSLAVQNRYYKKSAAFCLRTVARHSPTLAQAVVDCGALESLVHCLEDFDPGVKESAAWALGNVASHNSELSQQVGLCPHKLCVPSTSPAPLFAPCICHDRHHGLNHLLLWSQ